MIRAWIGLGLLAGALPLSVDTAFRWPAAIAWQFPVPFSRELAEADGCGAGYLITRGVGGAGGHQGADLSNRRAGGIVRAVANGVVIVAGGGSSGYGEHVVLAHRLGDGRLIYTIYAHLESRSIAVSPATIVHAGDPLGRVGRTGIATSPHLHFEVRTPRRAEQRWETTPVADPLLFVSEHLADTDSTFAR